MKVLSIAATIMAEISFLGLFQVEGKRILIQTESKHI
jgi:hypothetical protein